MVVGMVVVDFHMNIEGNFGSNIGLEGDFDTRYLIFASDLVVCFLQLTFKLVFSVFALIMNSLILMLLFLIIFG